MGKYLLKEFDQFVIEQILRGDNSSADALEKLPSSRTMLEAKNVSICYLAKPIIYEISEVLVLISAKSAKGLLETRGN